MQKMKKVLISLLACLCVGTAACGFAACKDDENAGTGGTGTGGLGGLGGLGGGGNTDDGNTDDGNTDEGGNGGATAQVMVIFDAGYGEFENEADSVQVVNVNSTLTMPTPTRDGYVLNGWQLANGTKWDATQKVTTNVTLYAIWKKDVQEYDVRFNLNYDGAEVVTLSTEEGKVTYIPEREGYVFRGWWQGSGLSTKFDMNTVVTSDGLELYAEWVEEDKAEAKLATPAVTRVGDTFTWNAVEGAESYRIRVCYYGNSEDNYSYEDSTSSTEWTFPSSYSYGDFYVYIRANGDGETKVNSNSTQLRYKHRYLAQVSNIKLDPFTSLLTWNGVENADYYRVEINGYEVASYLYETKYDMSDYTVGGYNIEIYACSNNSNYQSSYVSDDVNKLKLNTPTNLSCSFELQDNEYTFSWNSVSGVDSYELTLNGTPYTAYDTYYTINGEDIEWNDDNQVVYSVKAQNSDNNYLKSDASDEYSQDKVIVSGITVNDSITLVNDAHLVTFDLNDGNGTVYTTQYVTATNRLEYPTMPTRNYYLFTGWYTDSDCTSLYDFSAAVTEDVILYAGWYYQGSSNVGSIQSDTLNSYTTYSIYTEYSTQYYYFAAPLRGLYTLYYWNGSSYSSNRTYMSAYNSTQDITIKLDECVTSTSSAATNFTAEAGDIICISAYKYNSSTNFYFYITTTLPEGGTASGVNDAETTLTTNDRTTYYEMNDTATLTSSLGNEYTFLGWYDETDTRISENRTYQLTVGDTDATYTAKWTKNRSATRGLSFSNAIQATSGNSYVTLIEKAGQVVYYSFTPTVSGYYKIYSSNNSADTYGYLYDSSYSCIENDDDDGGNNNFAIKDTYLYAGSTYYIAVRMYSSDNTGSFTVNIALPGSSFAEAIEVSSGGSYTTNIVSNGQDVYYKFVPTVSGSYTFYSTGSYDTEVYFYNSVYNNEAYNDQGGSNNNFSLTYNLVAGNTYYFIASMYGS
ncbi:MAG: InlB B-repeat-containing protein, partial [Clostridia bacterium]|nr:InlB B-repeat-containing protein [Clostridia bacterium]